MTVERNSNNNNNSNYYVAVNWKWVTQGCWDADEQVTHFPQMHCTILQMDMLVECVSHAIHTTGTDIHPMPRTRTRFELASKANDADMKNVCFGKVIGAPKAKRTNCKRSGEPTPHTLANGTSGTIKWTAQCEWKPFGRTYVRHCTLRNRPILSTTVFTLTSVVFFRH